MWADLVWATACALGLMMLPGLVVGLIAGLRGMALAGVAVPVGVSVIALASLASPLVGIGWSVLPVGLVAVAMSIVVTVLRMCGVLRLSRFRVGVGGPWWVGLLAIAAGAVIAGFQVVRAIGTPDAISQTFDNIFHLNAVRYVLDTANASSFHVASLTSPEGGQAFYPAAWHAIVALVVETSGVTIPVAVNAVTLCVSAVIWPLGIVFLTRAWFGGSAQVTVAAAVLSASLPQFPLLLMGYGVLYPLQLAYALLPSVLALVIRALGVGAPGSRPSMSVWLLIAFLIPGLALSHPGAFVALLALSLPAVIIATARAIRLSQTPRRRIGFATSAFLYLAAGALAVHVLRPPADARTWPPETNFSDAVADALTFRAGGYGPALIVAALTIAGVVLALRRRRRRDVAVVAVWIAAVGLYVVVASLHFWTVRDAIVGSWYNNIPRLAALLPLASVPLAADSAARVWNRVSAYAGRKALSAVACRVVGVGLVVAFAVVVQFGPLWAAVSDVRAQSFALTDNSPLVDRDEVELLDRLSTEVPPGAVIAGSPWTGAALAYALADRKVTLAHTLAYESADVRELNADLGYATRSDSACTIAREMHVEYILDFGSREVHGGSHPFRGVQDLANSSSVELVDHVGTARLYRLTACG